MGRAVALMTALVLVWGGPGAAAAAASEQSQGDRPSRERHCFHPSGADMNEVHGTNHRIITEFCSVAMVGESWIPFAFWITATSYEVVPEGYTPSRPTPIEDFNAKFVGARYVVDAGTRRQRKLPLRGIPDPADGAHRAWHRLAHVGFPRCPSSATGRQAHGRHLPHAEWRSLGRVRRRPIREPDARGRDPLQAADVHGPAPIGIGTPDSRRAPRAPKARTGYP